MAISGTDTTAGSAGNVPQNPGQEKPAMSKPSIFKKIFRRSSRSSPRSPKLASQTSNKEASQQTSNKVAAKNLSNGWTSTPTLSPVVSHKERESSNTNFSVGADIVGNTVANTSVANTSINANVDRDDKPVDEHSEGELDLHELMSDEDGDAFSHNSETHNLLDHSAGVDVDAILASTAEQDLGFPKYIKITRKNNKSPRVLNNLFLAQELQSPPSASNSASYAETLNEDSEATSNGDTNTTKTPMNPNEILVMEFSRDGKYLAVAGRDSRIAVWQVLSSPLSRLKYKTLDKSSQKSKSKVFGGAPVFLQEPVRVFEGHTKAVLCLSWSKNNFLLSGSMDHTVRLWNIERAECLDTFPHRDFVTALRFHPTDDRFFISGALDNQLRLWSILEKSVAYTSDLGDNALITAVEFTPMGNHCIVGGFNGSLFAVETQGLHLVKRIELRKRHRPPLGNSARGTTVSGIKIFENPTCTDLPGTELAKWNVLITTNDSTVRLVDLSLRKLVTRFRGNSNESSSIVASLSEDNRYIVSGSEDHCCYVWDNNNSIINNKLRSSMKEMLLEGRNQLDEKHKTISRLFNDNRLWRKLPMQMFLEDENGKKYIANDNTSYSSFHAHHSRVNVALFAPEKTKTLLKFSDDKIFELVKRGTLLAESKGTDFNSESAWGSDHIIVTSDVSGLIRVFRQDPAFYIRKNLLELKKMQKRSGSRSRNRTNSTGQASENGHFVSDGNRARSKSPSLETLNIRDKLQSKIRVPYSRCDSSTSLRMDAARARSNSDLSRHY